MSYLEIITLRVAREAKTNLLRDILKELDVQNQVKEKMKGLRIYQRTIGLVEMAIALLWEGGECTRKGSSLGQRLSAAFKEFGAVTHQVWEEAAAPEKVKLAVDVQ